MNFRPNQRDQRGSQRISTGPATGGPDLHFGFLPVSRRGGQHGVQRTGLGKSPDFQWADRWFIGENRKGNPMFFFSHKRCGYTVYVFFRKNQYIETIDT